MAVTFGKVLSAVLAVGYAVVLVAAGEVAPVIRLGGCLFLVLPIALIWFPEKIGSFTGYVGRGGNISMETPPFLVSAAGWFFLVGLPLIVVVINR